MTTANQARILLLLDRQSRQKLLPGLVARWAEAGVAVSPLSHERHEALVAELRRRGGERRAVAGTLANIIAAFARPADMAVVIGWAMDSEPGLLVRSAALVRSEAFLRAVYPDGFFMIDQPASHMLVVSFDEDMFEAKDVRLDRAG